MPKNYDIMGRQNLESSGLEGTIASFEQEMSIHSPGERFLEASLFIDRKFVLGALLTDSPIDLERMFGTKEWATYLHARLLTRHFDSKYGEENVMDMVEDIDFCLMGAEGYPIVPYYRGLKGGSAVAFVDGEITPIEFTAEQVAALKRRRYVSFLGGSAINQFAGYLIYNDIPPESLAMKLFDVLDVLNADTKLQSPFEIAARMQQEFIEIHPFIGGMNGRHSRILMNWYLERCGENPSLLADFDADLLTDGTTWITRVENGSKLYASIAAMVQAGVNDPIDLLNMRTLKVFHDHIYRPSPGIVTPVYVPNAQHPHAVTELYLRDFYKAASHRFAGIPSGLSDTSDIYDALVASWS